MLKQLAVLTEMDLAAAGWLPAGGAHQHLMMIAKQRLDKVCQYCYAATLSDHSSWEVAMHHRLMLYSAEEKHCVRLLQPLLWVQADATGGSGVAVGEVEGLQCWPVSLQFQWLIG